MDILHVDKMEVYSFLVNMLKVSHCGSITLFRFHFHLDWASKNTLLLGSFLFNRSLCLIFVTEGVADADLVLLVTTRPTTGNTLAWAVACERDQWGRAIAGNSCWPIS